MAKKLTVRTSFLKTFSCFLIAVLKLAFSVCCISMLTACDTNQPNNSSKINTSEETNSDKAYNSFSQNLSIEYQVVDNLNALNCKELVESGQCFDGVIQLTLKEKLKLGPWKIFFSNMSPILSDSSDKFNIKRVNGDLHYIEPTEKFLGWNGNVSVSIAFKAEFWHISEFDSPPNFYLVTEDFPAIVIRSTLSQIDPESKQEILLHMKPFVDPVKQFKRNQSDGSKWATSAELYQANSRNDGSEVDETYRIIPKPKKVNVISLHKVLELSHGVFIRENEFAITQNNPALKRMQRLGVPLNNSTGVPIEIRKTSNISTDSETKFQHRDSYRLSITAESINIEAQSKIGAFYAIQSINALYKPAVMSLPLVEVEDEPRYEFRGLFLDVARNFRDKDFIIKMLDQMAAYKLNKLHLHMGDDEGWRLEIPGLPELTQLGSTRCHDLEESECLLPQLGSGPEMNNPNNGHYSLDDYRSILREASARHIQVIPSFDMPGHSRAAVKSMLLRYKRFMALGNKELAEEYLLTDVNDQTVYSSVQFYSDNTLNVCRESTYRFIEKVLTELISLHRLSESPLETYHIGTDETAGAWKESPECQNFMKENNLSIAELSQYFIHRVSRFLDAKEVQVGGWSDGLSHTLQSEMPDNVHVNIWKPLYWGGHKVANEMTNKDWDVILSLPDVTYFDFPYEADPKERGYYWGSRFTNTRQIFEWMPDNLPAHAEIWNDRYNNPMVIDDRHQEKSKDNNEHRPLKEGATFKGIQAQLWSEMIRTDDIAEYMLFPRLLALAERAWYKPDWELAYDHSGQLYSRDSHLFTSESKNQRNQDWSEFASALAKKEFSKLDIDEVSYRIPTVGAIIVGGKLKLNSIFPGLNLEYQIDQGQWNKYSDVNGIDTSEGHSVSVRATNHDGSRKGRSLEVLTDKIH